LTKVSKVFTHFQIHHRLIFLRKKKFIFRNVIFLFCILNGQSTHAGLQDVTSEKDSLIKELSSTIAGGLEYLAQIQIKESIEGKQYAGEWPTEMVMQHGFFLLGGRRKAMDSNCFSVASTHNILAKIYLENNAYQAIPALLSPAFQLLQQYKNGDRYNFWNLLPPNKKLFRGDTLFPKVPVRRPTQFKLRSKYINKAANVVEDADDTGLAYTAQILWKKIDSTRTYPEKKIAPLFDEYRDLNRKNRHWYNFINESREDENSGAYLTWHAKEFAFKKWDIAKVAFHNATFYLPFSECYPFAYKPYLPYGSNDLDAVVNANILSTLALHGETDALGYADAVQYLIKKCEQQKFDRVATYYPNRFQLSYAVANAYDSGVIELEKCKPILTNYLLKKQRKNGSWKSAPHINHGDPIQSTAYALNCLLLFHRPQIQNMEKEIKNAVVYLLNNSRKDGQQVSWKGGVMFSGGTVVRTGLFWKSDAYTTALVLRALIMYKNYLENAGHKK